MNVRRLVIILCTITFATGALAFGRQAHRAAGIFSLGSATAGSKSPQTLSAPSPQAAPSSQSSSPASGQTPAIPKHVIYGLLFQEVAAFNKKAEEKEKQGQSGAALRHYHGQRAGLKDRQADDFERIAAETARKVAILDEKAKKIIDADRARHADVKFKGGEPLPTPPAELKELEEQRQTLILDARENLRKALGDAEFQRFEDFVQREIAGKIKPVQRVVNRP